MMTKFVKAAQAGDISAWNFLYNQHQPWLYAMALRACGNTPFAKDAVQDTFIQAWLKISQLKDLDAFAAWLKIILHRICFRYRHREQSVDLNLLKEPADDEINRSLDLYAQHARLHYAVKNLSEPLQSVIMMRYFSSYQSYDEIAYMLGIPAGTVRSRLNQAKQKIAAFWMEGNNINDDAYRRAQEWNHTYKNYFSNVHSSLYWREKLINHFQPTMKVIFTSGKTVSGKEPVVRLIEEDLQYGTEFGRIHIISSNSISIIETENINSREFPDRCPETSVLVLFRDRKTVCKMNLHNSAGIANAL